MPTQFAMLSIMNAALTVVGYDEIVSENDGTPEFRALSRNWPLIVESELEAGLYDFTKQQATLISRIDGKFGKADGYLIPGDALVVRHLWLDKDGVRDFVDWVSDGEAVYVDNADGCVIEYLSVPDPSIWSANFSRGVQHKLEAVLHRMVAEQGPAQMADALARDAFEAARTISSKQRAARPMMRTGELVLARRTRGPH